MINKNSPSRTRIYACVVYEDSAPKNWKDIISNEFVPAFISPYHNCDHDPDGEIKKPHWHVMIMYDGVKTKEQFEEFRDRFGGVGAEIVASKRGYARYLCHLDNPEKYRYNIDDVIELSGADYKDCISRDSDKYKTIKAMLSYIGNNHIMSYRIFMDYCMEYEPEWYACLVDKATYVVSSYIDSIRKDDYFNL